MQQQTSDKGSYVGKDFVCHTCGCEIMVKHWGDPEGHAQSGVFLCHCGTTMEPERKGDGGETSFGGETEQSFSKDDFLNQGSGTGAAPGGGM
jgi:hypothetical protein